MIFHGNITNIELRSLIRRGKITIAGNKKLKIYGSLACKSGKRMKRENRVFFETDVEAIGSGFRRCKVCGRAGRVKLRIVVGDPAL